MAFGRHQKSTIVRAQRLAFKLGEALMPTVAARVTTGLWFTVPSAAAAPEVPRGGTPFAVTAQASTVRGSSWGDGPAVYLVHGWGGTGAQLTMFVTPLVRRGYRVVLFDAPSHGSSDPGPSGPGSGNVVEFGRALDAVSARFGPAHAVIAHSMGAVATMLTLKYGWLSTQRLVFLAPMAGFSGQFQSFQHALAIGPRTRRQAESLIVRRVGVPLAQFELATLLSDVGAVPTLIIHDRDDRQTSFIDSRRLADALPQVSFVGTRGLGHQRLIKDAAVVQTVLGFVAGEVVAPGDLGEPVLIDQGRVPTPSGRSRDRSPASVHSVPPHERPELTRG